MTLPFWVWGLSVAAIVAMLVYDFFFHTRKAHVPSLREASIWSAVYVGIALLFGVLVLVFGGTTMGGEYFAGCITEKALSVDNLFVFLIIMGSFRVPREDQQKVLHFGIAFALVARTVFIFIGAGLIATFSWVFYVFGLILILTAGNLLKGEVSEGDPHEEENLMVKLAKKLVRTSEHYDGDKLFTEVNGKRVLTPVPADLTLEDIESWFATAATETSRVLGATPLGTLASDTGRLPDDRPTLHGVLPHVVQEYARHTGHLDVVVELAGGPTGE